MNKNEVSLIISFYNKINFLKIVLSALEKQTFKKFEVIIADDGSSNEIVNILKKTIENSCLLIKHIWHEDKGWRKNVILNKAIEACSSEYIIFIDGDCIPHRRFIEEHFINRQEGVVLAGRRVNLSKFASSIITEKRVGKTGFIFCVILLSFILKIFGKGNHIENGIYIRSRYLRKYINIKEKGILGSNFSVHKSDLLAINGFDERFIYPAAGEDTDIRNRFRNNNVKIKTVKHIAIQYHLFHKPLERNHKNLVLLEENLKNKLTYTYYGIKK